MRTLITVMGILGIFGFSASAQTTTDKPQTSQACLLKVSGMHCGACAARVEKIAKNIDGVNTAKVSQPKGERRLAERVGFVHLRGFHLRASRYGGQVAATADLIVPVSQPSRGGVRSLACQP